MDEQVRKDIIGLFKDCTVYMEASLVPDLVRLKKLDPLQVSRTIHAMRDNGELVPEGTHGAFRLSSKITTPPTPFWQKAWRDMMDSPLVTIGLMVSMLGNIILIIGIIFKK